MKDRCLIVTGMHRSGTSLLANILQASGVYWGSDLIEGSSFNKSGYFEDLEVVDFHDMTLRANGTDWRGKNADPEQGLQLDRQNLATILTKFEGRNLWGVKDPRITLFLNEWKEVLDERGTEACFIFLIRRPDQILFSLLGRGEIPDMDRVRLYLRTVRIYESKLLNFRSEEPQRTLVLRSRQVVEDPEKILMAVERNFGVGPLDHEKGKKVVRKEEYGGWSKRRFGLKESLKIYLGILRAPLLSLKAFHLYRRLKVGSYRNK